MKNKARMFVCVAGLLSFAGCSKNTESTRDEGGQTVTGTTQDNEVARAAEFASSLPREGGPTGYFGSESCRSCHEQEFSSWHRTYHRTMTQFASSDSVKADFNNVSLTSGATRFVLSRSGDEYWVRMERAIPPEPGESAPEPVDVRMGLVTGSHHMQVFWIPNGMGNCQIGFPFTWLIPEKRWVPRNSTFLRPPSVDLRPETWNFVCARCHATGPEPNLDRASLNWQTQVAELGISCEACHGPGEKHVVRQRELRGIPEENRPKNEPLEIVHPERLSPARASQVCGFCHSMKWWDSAEGWPEHGFSFRPGDDLETSTPVIRPAQIEKQPWLKGVIEKHPDLFEDFFWRDGMIRVSGREYNGLIESPCYNGGQFSCLSCHSLHKSEPADLLARNRKDNAACTQCHEQFRDESLLTSHSRHRPGSSGSECYNCHMPHTTYGVLTAIRSHQVSSPSVADQIATGRPNACNLCHLDKTLEWTAGQLKEWYAHRIPELAEDQSSVADSVLQALTGDGGQRALIAWHLAWEPALEVSGKSWIPPVLAILLDDPYSAVRCVAERSLKSQWNLLAKAYDYTIPLDSRAPAYVAIWSEWNKAISESTDLPLPVHSLVRWNDPGGMQEDFARLARRRDDRDVRLRE